MKRLAVLAVMMFFVAMHVLGLAAVAGESPSKPSKDDKCPVCGMFVAKYPDFIAQVVFKDGHRAFFDGAKDMFKYYLNLEKYKPGKKISDIEAIYVTDYYGLRPIDGLKAYYVVGSDVYGPMGRELIPFEQEADANEFTDDHHAKSLLRFEQVTPDLLKTLD